MSAEHKISVDIDNKGKIHLQIDDSNFELSRKNAMHINIRLKKVLRLKQEFDFWNQKDVNPDRFREE